MFTYLANGNMYIFSLSTYDLIKIGSRYDKNGGMTNVIEKCIRDNDSLKLLEIYEHIMREAYDEMNSSITYGSFRNSKDYSNLMMRICKNADMSKMVIETILPNNKYNYTYNEGDYTMTSYNQKLSISTEADLSLNCTTAATVTSTTTDSTTAVLSNTVVASDGYTFSNTSHSLGQDYTEFYKNYLNDFYNCRCVTVTEKKEEKKEMPLNSGRYPWNNEIKGSTKSIKVVKVEVLNDRVVIVRFADGTFTKAVITNDDYEAGKFDIDIGITICLMKKILGEADGYKKAYEKAIKGIHKMMDAQEKEKKEKLEAEQRSKARAKRKAERRAKAAKEETKAYKKDITDAIKKALKDMNLGGDDGK